MARSNGKTPKPPKGRVQSVRKVVKEEVKKYNSNKQATHKQKLGRFLYKVGFFIEVEFILLYKKIVSFVYIAARILDEWVGIFSDIVGRVVTRAGKDIAAPFARMRNGIKNMRMQAKELKETTGEGTGSFIVRYIVDGVKKYIHLLKDATEWALPFAALCSFLFVVSTMLNYNYTLAVEYNGEIVGYVPNDTVYEEANQQVQKRMVYEEGEEQWNMNPTFVIARASEEEVQDADALVNTILEASGEDIIEATGLYVDGVFYGATTEPEKLQADLDATLEPYRVENYLVDFVNEVDVKEGIYLTKNVVDYDAIHQNFGNEIEGERTYTLVEGDSPSLIASKNDVTTNELYAMNPGLEDRNIYPGDVVVVGQSRAFLQVKQVNRVVEEEVIVYERIVTKTDEMYLGESKVITQGSNGLNHVTYDYTYIDGVLVDKERIHTEVVTPVINQEELQGSRLRAPTGAASGSSGMILPLPAGFRYSRGFSSRHTGADLAISAGTPIYAVSSGVVTKAAYTYSGYGVHLIIDHGNGVSTLYAHCSALAVTAGQGVSQGQVVGYVGSTGYSTGNHLHFEVRINGRYVNTMPYIGY